MVFDVPRDFETGFQVENSWCFSLFWWSHHAWIWIHVSSPWVVTFLLVVQRLNPSHVHWKRAKTNKNLSTKRPWYFPRFGARNQQSQLVLELCITCPTHFFYNVTVHAESRAALLDLQAHIGGRRSSQSHWRSVPNCKGHMPRHLRFPTCPPKCTKHQEVKHFFSNIHISHISCIHIYTNTIRILTNCKIVEQEHKIYCHFEGRIASQRIAEWSNTPRIRQLNICCKRRNRKLQWDSGILFWTSRLAMSVESWTKCDRITFEERVLCSIYTIHSIPLQKLE